jgi:hypothetical protein
LNWYRRRASRGKAVQLVPTEGFERQGGSVGTDGGLREARRFSWYQRRVSRGKKAFSWYRLRVSRQGFVFVEPVHQLVPTRGFDEGWYQRRNNDFCFPSWGWYQSMKQRQQFQQVGHRTTCKRLVPTKEYPAESLFGTNGNTCKRLVPMKQ